MSPDSFEPRLERQHRRPLWLAALVTVFATPLVVTLLLKIADPFFDEQLLSTEGGSFEEFVVMFAGGVPICAVSMFVIALPLMLALRHQGWLVVPGVCVVTALAGAIGFAGVAYVSLRTRMGSDGLALGAGMGLIAGLLFSLVAGIGFRRKALSSAAITY